MEARNRLDTRDYYCSSVARASLLRDFDNHRFTIGHGVKGKAEAAEGASGVGTFELDRSRFNSVRRLCWLELGNFGSF